MDIKARVLGPPRIHKEAVIIIKMAAVGVQMRDLIIATEAGDLIQITAVLIITTEAGPIVEEIVMETQTLIPTMVVKITGEIQTLTAEIQIMGEEIMKEWVVGVKMGETLMNQTKFHADTKIIE